MSFRRYSTISLTDPPTQGVVRKIRRYFVDPLPVSVTPVDASGMKYSTVCDSVAYMTR